MEIWIGLDSDADPGEDITFNYGTNVGAGEGGFATIGAENKFGNRGAVTFIDGTGTLPDPENDVLVTTTPGTVHEAVVTFKAKAATKKATDWTNCATLTSSGFLGTSYSCVSGTISKAH